ncbi:MAG TPA: CPBP family intramembrane metalloprotease [Propionibacterium sp.]|jgi:membrane protease YdiL (CAAX protease family)|nr:CPBP family intramembrane metalloprotease [Propionibacterium sp.]
MSSPHSSIASPRVPASWPVIIGVLLLRTVLLFATTTALIPVTGSYLNALAWGNVTIVAVDIISVIVIAALLRRQGRSLRELIGAKLSDTGWGLVLWPIATIGFVAASFIGNLVAYQGPPPATTLSVVTPPLLFLALWTTVIMSATVAIAEEVLYRGWAQTELTTRTNRGLGLVIMAFFFALQHAALTPLELRAQVARFITTFLAGLMFGALYLWRKRLWPLIIAHWLLDVVGLGLPILLAALS